MPTPKIIKPRPLTAREVINRQIPEVQPGTKPPLPEHMRADELSVKSAKVKNFSINFEDIDEAVLYYFNNVIKPTVVENGTNLPVPVRIANAERWTTAQKEGGLRDKDGKFLFPVITLKKDSIDKDRTIGNKLDGNKSVNYHIFEQTYTKENQYDNFAAITNRVPVKRYGLVVVPDYCKIQYSCAVYTNYQEDLNKILESILFASDSYWGDPQRFTFMTKVDSMPITQELNTQEDRKIYSTFLLTLNGHIIPDTINKQMATQTGFFSRSQVRFGTEVVGRDGFTKKETTTATSGNATDKVSFPERIIKNNNALSTQTALYLSTSISKGVSASDIQTDRFYIRGVKILDAPEGLPSTSKESFFVFVNGQYIYPSEVISISQVGSDVLVMLDSVNVGYTLSPTDEIEVKGKFES